MRSETKNGVTTTYDNRGNINTTTANSNVNSGPAYNNNSGNNNNSTYTMVTCTVCNGTGLQPNTADDLSYYKENIPYVDKGISLVTLIKDVEHAMEQERDKRIKDKSLESMIH